jgi:TetR/AcrR family transcriptional regulator, regulator of cefoperazone and chloramphenicol sensitivity
LEFKLQMSSLETIGMASTKSTMTLVPKRRPRRSDGQVTQIRILETAGRVFAERGYGQTTSKEICKRAKTNQAAVNYHFGSREGLYEAVLIEAHRQVVDLDDLSAWATGPGEARDRLAAVLDHLLSLATEGQDGWEFPVLLREILNPSPVMSALAIKAIKPKARVLLRLVADVTGLRPDHPCVQRALFFCVVPCILMAIAPPPLKANVLPSLNKDPEGLREDFMRYVFAGLDALGHPTRCTGNGS